MKRTIITLTAIMLFSLMATAQQPKDTAAKKAVNDVTKGAETTQQFHPTTYYLLGNIGDFQLLYKALLQPGDVTPNQVKALGEWIDKNTKALPVPIDSSAGNTKQK